MGDSVMFLLVLIYSIPAIILYCLIIKVLRRLCNLLDLKIIESERNLDKFL